MQNLIRRFISHRRGATALEYALIVSLISIVVAASATALGVKMYNLIGTATNGIH